MSQFPELACLGTKRYYQILSDGISLTRNLYGGASGQSCARSSEEIGGSASLGTEVEVNVGTCDH